jgi:hypothetical protein
LFAGGLLSAPAAHADVRGGLNVAPPPALVVASPPPLAAVPGSSVFYGTGARYNLFVYGNRYYSVHKGTWFSVASSGGAWRIIPTERVPKPVLAVPTTYYAVPSGQGATMGAHAFVQPGQARNNKHN